jgi:hypothetical protein
MRKLLKLRGRAASPVRPGLIVKKVLGGKEALANGEFVTETSISDIHRVYKRLIYEENQLRTREHRLRGMNIHSFTTLFKFARYLGLVEFVRNDNRLFDYGGNLYRVEGPTGVEIVVGKQSSAGLHIVKGNRKIYKLSEKGLADHSSWFDLRRAWMEWRSAQVGT